MSSVIRYTGPSGPDPDALCPVCNKLMIITYPNKSREAGVAFQCPYCYEWLRIKVSDYKPSDLNEDEAKRWQAVEIIRLDKAVQKNTDTEIFKWETQ